MAIANALRSCVKKKKGFFDLKYKSPLAAVYLWYMVHRWLGGGHPTKREGGFFMKCFTFALCSFIVCFCFDFFSPFFWENRG